jgi:hypothetical protein
VPFQQWNLPVAIQRVRDRILKRPQGDPAFVELLMLAREVGCQSALCQSALNSFTNLEGFARWFPAVFTCPLSPVAGLLWKTACKTFQILETIQR